MSSCLSLLTAQFMFDGQPSATARFYKTLNIHVQRGIDSTKLHRQPPSLLVVVCPLNIRSRKHLHLTPNGTLYNAQYLALNEIRSPDARFCRYTLAISKALQFNEHFEGWSTKMHR